ncbi:MAG: pentapeptide repeat-containing protein [Halobacteriales archaeon]|nr:pentapeptide repeat-containing protein [Halobacteriales archaeon]
MAGICKYVFEPDEGGGSSKTSLNSAWECPHPAHADGDYCVFHLGTESRRIAGVSDDEVRNAFVRTVESTEPGEPCRFIGASFGATVVEKERFGENARIIDLRNAEFDGRFELESDVVGSHIIADYSNLEIFGASSTVFEGGVSFRGCSFDGKVNLDSTRFMDKVLFEKAVFDLSAEFSEAVFEKGANFRLSKQKGAQTSFKNAVFRDDTYMSRVNFDKADFTGAEFHGDTEFTGATFNKETKFQYSDFDGSVDFGNSEFNGNSVFRGASFTERASFEDASFQGWSSFLDVELKDDVSFESVWFKSELNMVAESENNAIIDFTGARTGKASFEIESEKPVALDFVRARVGNISISADSKNPLDSTRFVETKFNGFRFSEYADHLAEKNYVIHESAVKKEEDVSLPSLEKTYRLAAEGAKGDDKSIASKFAKKEAKYRRKKYRDEGKILRYLLDFLPF